MRKIQDEFSHIPSRSRRYQLRLKRDGLCIKCGLPQSSTSSTYCAKHEKIARNQCRKEGGFKPWRPGGPGRPPNSRR